MAWRLPGDKPLSEQMMVRLPTHKCVTRPQWVNTFQGEFCTCYKLVVICKSDSRIEREFSKCNFDGYSQIIPLATSHYLNRWWLDCRRIYALLGLNELKVNHLAAWAFACYLSKTGVGFYHMMLSWLRLSTFRFTLHTLKCQLCFNIFVYSVVFSAHVTFIFCIWKRINLISLCKNIYQLYIYICDTVDLSIFGNCTWIQQTRALHNTTELRYNKFHFQNCT